MTISIEVNGIFYCRNSNEKLKLKENSEVIDLDGHENASKKHVIVDNSHSRKIRTQVDNETQNEDGSYTCSVCSQTLKSRGIYVNHLRRVHSEQTYKCPKCPKTYGCQLYRDRHLEYAHEGKYCRWCKRKVNKMSEQEFKEHVSIKHNFSCRICFFMYDLKSVGKEHMEAVQ